MKNDVLIVGAGPAGIAAALELNRRNVHFKIIEKNEVGGIAVNANFIRNYPAFPDGISGTEFVHLMQRQLKKLAIDVSKGNVNSIGCENGQIYAEISGVKSIFGAVIIATGTVPKRAGFNGEEELFSAGKLFYDISQKNFADLKDVVVLGGGDVGFDYVISLIQKNVSAKIISRSEPKAIEFLRANAKKFGIEIRQNDAITLAKLNGEGKVIITTANGEKLATDAIVVAVGRKANLSLLNELNGIEIYSNGCTSMPKIFLAGDVLHPDLRQIGIAVGDGIRAATNAAKIVEK